MIAEGTVIQFTYDERIDLQLYRALKDFDLLTVADEYLAGKREFDMADYKRWLQGRGYVTPFQHTLIDLCDAGELTMRAWSPNDMPPAPRKKVLGLF